MSLPDKYYKKTEEPKSIMDSIRETTKSSLNSLKDKFVSTDDYRDFSINELLDNDVKLVRVDQLELREGDYDQYSILKETHDLYESQAKQGVDEYLKLESQDKSLEVTERQIEILESLITLQNGSSFDLVSVEDIGPLRLLLKIKQKTLLNKLIVENLDIPFVEVERFMNGLIDGLESEGDNLKNVIDLIKNDPGKLVQQFIMTQKVLFEYLAEQGIEKVYGVAVENLADFISSSYSQDFANLPYYSGRLFGLVLVSALTAGAGKVMNPKAAMAALSALRIGPRVLPMSVSDTNPFEKTIVAEKMFKLMSKRFPKLSNKSADVLMVQLNYDFKNANNKEVILENLFSYFLGEADLNSEALSFVVTVFGNADIHKYEKLYLCNEVGLENVPVDLV